jgi:hypothetical protein
VPGYQCLGISAWVSVPGYQCLGISESGRGLAPGAPFRGAAIIVRCKTRPLAFQGVPLLESPFWSCSLFEGAGPLEPPHWSLGGRSRLVGGLD